MDKIIVDSPWPEPETKFEDLRGFLNALEKRGELKRVDVTVDPALELTEICHRTLTKQGPALLFTHPKGHDVPVLANLFGSADRIAAALGLGGPDDFQQLGKLLATLKAPEPPRGLGDAWQKLPLVKEIMKMR